MLGNEIISRGVFNPRHINPLNNNIKLALFRQSDLKICQLSVWRSIDDAGISQDELVEELSVVAKRTKQALYALVQATAEEIRSIPVFGMEDSQAFCIVDDTICDPKGRKHEAHANIGFSKSLLSLVGDEPDHEAMKMARRELKDLMQRSMIVL